MRRWRDEAAADRIGQRSGHREAGYRAHLPLYVLGDRGHELIGHRPQERLGLRELLSADVVHMHRMVAVQAAVKLREAGVGIVWDNDDTTEFPRTNPLYQRLGGYNARGEQSSVKAMVRVADVVTTPSEVLAAQYREMGATDVRVLENYLPREFAKVRPAKHQGLVIVWVAALEHQTDYQALRLRETLLRLLDSHPEVRVRSHGLNLGLAHERYEHIPPTGLLQLAKHLARCDIGIAPLTDIAFNRARSNIKLKEYASAGLAWLASPVGPYHEMSEQQGGRLVADNGWQDALERLLLKARERRKLAKRATRWATSQGIDQHAHKWETVLHDAVKRAQARRGAATRAASAG